MAIKAIIFDIDGVLIDSVKANAVFFERIFNALGVEYSQKEYVKLNHKTMWDLIRYFSKEKSKVKLVQMFEFAKKYPYPHEYIKIPKDARKALGILVKKYKLAVVTARVKVGVGPVLKRYGYLEYFKTAIAFEDFTKPKPHPESLLKAIKRLKIKPSEAIYVGDMRSDILCARAAKVKSILYKRPYSDLKKEKPDFIVKTFKELLTAVRNAE